MFIKHIECDWCKKKQGENVPGQGFPEWGQLNGINLNGVDNPCFCPAHMKKISNYIDSEIDKRDVD